VDVMTEASGQGFVLEERVLVTGGCGLVARWWRTLALFLGTAARGVVDAGPPRPHSRVRV